MKTMLERQLQVQGVSGQRLAALTGVSPADISKARNGYLRLYPGQAARVAEALEWDQDPALLFEPVEGGE